MRHSKQRKSQEILLHNQPIRKPKKYKTYSRGSLAYYRYCHHNCRNKGRSNQVSQSISRQFVNSLIQEISQQSEARIKKRVLENVSKGCKLLVFHLLKVEDLKCPSHGTQIKSECEPIPSECDPICGVDKMTATNFYKADKYSIDPEQRSLNKLHLHQAQWYRGHTSTSSFKSNGKEREANSKNLADAHSGSWTSNNSYRIKDRSKSSERLVPLLARQSQLNQSSEQITEDFYRDRLLKEISNKVSIGLKKITKISQSGQSHKVEEFNYDYNGQKINLLRNPTLKCSSNILKTVYRINKEKHQHRAIKNEQISMGSSLRGSLRGSLLQTSISHLLGKQGAHSRDVRLLSEAGDSSIKAKLEMEFRKQKMRVRPIYVD